MFSREFAARCENPRTALAGIELEHVELRGTIISVDQAVVFAEALGLDLRTLSSVPASYGDPGG